MTATLVQTLCTELDWSEPHESFSALADEPFALLLESTEKSAPDGGRWSFIACDPFETILLRDVETSPDPFALLKRRLNIWARPYDPSLPPFTGGAAGFFGYDLGQALEKLPPRKKPFAIDDCAMPDMAIGLYDAVIAFDHGAQRCFIFSSNAGGRNPVARANALKEKCAPARRKSYGSFPSLSAKADVPRAAYEASVARIIEYILAGDIFQANLSQRFQVEKPRDAHPYALYLKLRQTSPAPYASYFNFGTGQLLSSSPERFLACHDRKVLTQPIKGTRPRGQDEAEDRLLAEELLASSKDHAENVMIVDLLRNDLSKVCEDHSVKVSKLCALESFANVHHLVSSVTGILRRDCDVIDLLAACFPGGSITGAPKLRAMEIIAELERNTRGPYCGAIGYIGFDGGMDTSIAIRTMLASHDRISFQTGGGVVAESNPSAEYEETLAKAAAMQKALEAP